MFVEMPVCFSCSLFLSDIFKQPCSVAVVYFQSNADNEWGKYSMLKGCG